MFKYIIQKHINNLSINDIYKFALENNVTLNDYEANLIYKNIKSDWKTIIYSNHYIILDKIKDKIEPTTYYKLEELIILYKNKYKNYL